MRILFVHPPATHKDELAFQDIKSSSPSLGLLQLASIARAEGHQVSFMDREFSVQKFVDFNPDLVAITAMTNEIESASEIARFCLDVNVPTVLGGCHISADSYNTLIKYPEFGRIIEGEGEEKFISFLGGDIAKYKTMDDYPDPAFDLIDWSKYRLSPFGSKSNRSLGLVTSRGCFGKCTFCSRVVFGNKFKCLSVKRLVKMLCNIKSTFGIFDFLFYDDLFTGNKPRLLQFCEELITKKYGFTWSCCSRVDNLNYGDLQFMKQAGCWMIEYGIESGSQTILDNMKKGITLEAIRNAIRITRKAGILSKGNFILGFPGETHGTLKETINFANSLPLDLMQHTFMAPLPGTEVYETAHLHGEFNKDWSATNTFSINFVPKGLTKKDLKNASKSLTIKFYSNPCRLLHLLTKLTWRQLWLGLKTLLKFY
jgi:anaerobic magnesium-protoporphyrin IX monomethyl ester cyclase